MKTLKRLSVLVLAMTIMTVVGCGGGDGGGGTPAPPTKATLKLLSQGPAGTKIRGIEVTVVLPTGVTVKASPSATNPAILETNPGVVVLSGATVVDPAAFSQLAPLGIYSPATTAAPGRVFISLPAQADFNLGEFVTVNTDITVGSFPKAADFSQSGFTAVNLNGAIIPGVTASIVPDIR